MTSSSSAPSLISTIPEYCCLERRVSTSLLIFLSAWKPLSSRPQTAPTSHCTSLRAELVVFLDRGEEGVGVGLLGVGDGEAGRRGHHRVPPDDGGPDPRLPLEVPVPVDGEYQDALLRGRQCLFWSSTGPLAT